VRPSLTADASWAQTHLCLNLDCWNCVARLTDFSVDAPRSPPQLAVAVSSVEQLTACGPRGRGRLKPTVRFFSDVRPVYHFAFHSSSTK
jgi:hypothetical protein